MALALLGPQERTILLYAIAAPVHANPPEIVSSRTQELVNLPIRRRPELFNLVCSVRLSPRYVRLQYVCPDPRSFRVSLSGNGPLRDLQISHPGLR